MSAVKVTKKSDYKKLFTLDPKVFEKLSELAQDKTFNQSLFASNAIAEKLGLAQDSQVTEVADVDSRPNTEESNDLSPTNPSPADPVTVDSETPTAPAEPLAAFTPMDPITEVDSIIAPKVDPPIVAPVDAPSEPIAPDSGNICPTCGEDYTTPMCINCLGKPALEA